MVSSSPWWYTPSGEQLWGGDVPSSLLLAAAAAAAAVARVADAGASLFLGEEGLAMSSRPTMTDDTNSEKWNEQNVRQKQDGESMLF